MTRLESSDQWPPHPNADMQKQLKRARQFGWALIKLRSHSFGSVACPENKCKYLIYSTGASPGKAARDLGRLIDRCVHDGETSNLIATTRQHLEHADRLLDAAERMIKANDYEMVAEQLDEALGNLAAQPPDFEEAFEDFVRADDAARQAKADAGVASDQIASDVLRDAQDSVESAKQAAKTIKNTVPKRQQLLDSIKEARSRLDELLSRLTDVEEV